MNSPIELDMMPEPSPAAAQDVAPYPPPRQARFALVVLTATYILSFVDRQILSLLVEPMKRDLGITDFQVSLLQGVAFAGIYCLAGLPLGWAADRFSRRNLIMIGVALWSAMTALCGIARSYGALFLGRAGVGIGEAALSPAAYSLLSDFFPARRLPAAMSFYNMGPAVGAGLAFMLGGAIIALVGNLPTATLPLIGALRPWQAAFVLVGALGSVFVVLLLLIKEPPRRVLPADADRSASFPDTVRFFIEHRRSLGTLFGGLSLLSIVSYGTMAWYPSMLIRTYGENISRVGLTFGAVFMVASVAGNGIGAWGAVAFSDRGYRDPYIRWIVMVAAAVSILGACVPLMPTLLSTYASSALLLAAQGAFMAAGVSALHLAVPNRMRAQLTAILLFGTNIIGLVVGPSGVAALTQFVFHDPLAVRYALSIVSLSAGSLATLALWFSWRQFPRLTQGVLN